MRTRARRLAALLGMAMMPLAAGPLAAQDTEAWRPGFHFTPERRWMNDPNGMVWHDGEWHLFFQHNPEGIRWGHMSWGHAVSRDLVHWRTLPVALAEADGVMIFSGSAVVDRANTSGFGTRTTPPMVAVYTGHREGHQDQRIAFSLDRGRTWTKPADNPVLDLGMADFRDPKVFWHGATKRWIMVVSFPLEHRVGFFAAPDLRHWTRVGDFGPAGAVGGIWECPDLFEVPVDGGGTKWVLIVSLNPGAPAGGSGTQYFVGDFDGTRFVPDGDVRTPAWADYGADFYAGVSWNGGPPGDRRRVWLGWMSNWQYAQDVPTSPWRSAMSVPRELHLRRTPDGWRLRQTPVRELDRLRRGPVRRFRGSAADASAWLSAQRDLPPTLDLAITMEGVTGASPATIAMASGPGEETSLVADPAAATLALDRTRSGRHDFHEGFAARHVAPLRLADGTIRLRVLADRSSLEVFAQDGETVLTDLVLPTGTTRTWRFDGGGVPPRRVTIELRSLGDAARVTGPAAK